MRAGLRSFFERYVYPLVDALAFEEQAPYERARDEVQAARGSPSVDVDLRSAIDYILAYYTFMSTVVLGQRELQQQALSAALAGFAAEPAGAMSSLIQRRYHLQLRVLANNAEVQRLEGAEMDQLVAALAPAERHTEQWFYISQYYFRAGNLTRIVEAYEQYMESSSDWARDYNWRRLNVMMKLLDHSATRRDAELLIESIMVPGCAREIERSFWPHLTHLGLADDELQQQLRLRVEQLREPRQPQQSAHAR
jgi:hypothetical protein